MASSTPATLEADHPYRLTYMANLDHAYMTEIAPYVLRFQ